MEQDSKRIMTTDTGAPCLLTRQPEPMLLHILSYLDLRGLVRTRCTCVRLMVLGASGSFWRRFISLRWGEWPEDYPQLEENPRGLFWQEYKRELRFSAVQSDARAWLAPSNKVVMCTPGSGADAFEPVRAWVEICRVQGAWARRFVHRRLQYKQNVSEPRDQDPRTSWVQKGMIGLYAARTWRAFQGGNTASPLGPRPYLWYLDARDGEYVDVFLDLGKHSLWVNGGDASPRDSDVGQFSHAFVECEQDEELVLGMLLTGKHSRARLCRPEGPLPLLPSLVSSDGRRQTAVASSSFSHVLFLYDFFTEMPDEIVFRFLCRLPLRQLLGLATLNKGMRELVRSGSIWQDKLWHWFHWRCQEWETREPGHAYEIFRQEYLMAHKTCSLEAFNSFVTRQANLQCGRYYSRHAWVDDVDIRPFPVSFLRTSSAALTRRYVRKLQLVGGSKLVLFACAPRQTISSEIALFVKAREDHEPADLFELRELALNLPLEQDEHPRYLMCRSRLPLGSATIHVALDLDSRTLSVRTTGSESIEAELGGECSIQCLYDDIDSCRLCLYVCVWPGGALTLFPPCPAEDDEGEKSAKQ